MAADIKKRVAEAKLGGWADGYRIVRVACDEDADPREEIVAAMKTKARPKPKPTED